jgi:sugar lactone lactonase YvrE
MQHWLVATFSVFSLLAAALTGPGGASAGCQFVLGFAAFAAQIPPVVGQCLDAEQHDPGSGDALQHTTTGLLVWRKADNAIAFTDGAQTWVQGVLGIERRPNNERFIWEANSDHLPLAAETAPGGALGGGVPASHPSTALPIGNRAAWHGVQLALQAGTTVALAMPAPSAADLGSMPTVSSGPLPAPTVALLPDGDSVLTLAIPTTAAGAYTLVARWPDGQQASLQLAVGPTVTLANGIGNPDDLTVAPDGTVLYTDLATNTVGQVLAGGSRRTLISGLNVPEGMAITAADALLVADQGTNRVVQWTAPGGLQVLTQLAVVRGVDGIDGLGAAVIGDRLTALLPNSATGQLLLLPLGASTATVFPGQWQRPTDAVVSAGQLYVVDEYGGRVWRGPLSGPLQAVGPALTLPDDVVIDTGGSAYVNTLGQGPAGGGIVRINANGQSSSVLTGLNDPQGIDLDGAGNLLFAESGAGRLAVDIRSCRPLLLGNASVTLNVGGAVQALPLGTDCSAGQPTFALAPGAQWPAPAGTAWPASSATAVTLANGARAALVAGDGTALLLLQPPSAAPGGAAPLAVQMRLGQQVISQQVVVTVSPSPG